MSRFSRPRSSRIPYLPPYSAALWEVAESLPTRVIPGCPERGIRDVLEPYEQCIEESGPRSIIGRNNEKVTGE